MKLLQRKRPGDDLKVEIAQYDEIKAKAQELLKEDNIQDVFAALDELSQCDSRKESMRKRQTICPECGGKGRRYLINSDCYLCNGLGYIKNACPACKGRGYWTRECCPGPDAKGECSTCGGTGRKRWWQFWQ
jgi:DnaJ-class molecular chaperone